MELKAWQVFSLNQHQILWTNIIYCMVDSKEFCQWDLWREMSNLWKYLIQTTWIRRELEIIMTGKMTSVCYVQTWHPLFRLGDHCNIFHMWYLLIGWWRDYDSKRELAKVSSTLTIFKFLAGKEQRKPESLSVLMNWVQKTTESKVLNFRVMVVMF